LRTWSIARSPLNDAGMGGCAEDGELVETPICGFGGASFFGQPEIINDSGAINASA